MKFEFRFSTHHFGGYNKKKKIVFINLPSFTSGGHTHDGVTDGDFNPSDQQLMDDICYCIEHEYLHYIQHKLISNIQSLPTERIIYYMIGNGGNEYFNIYYNITIDDVWWP